MIFSRVLDLRWPLLLLLIIADIVHMLEVQVNIPQSVKKGESANIICRYNLEGDTLYSIKWYKGRREFFRFTPKENPAKKTFPLVGITVERSVVNASHIAVLTVEPLNSAKYSCEVSADAPSFHTQVVSGEMEVVEIPLNKPNLIGVDDRKYRPGEIFKGNCSSEDSKPAANLTWTINDMPADLSYIRHYKSIKDESTNLETSILGLHFFLTHQNFIKGKLKIRCISRIHDIWNEFTEKIIDEDRPQVLLTSVSSVGPNVNFIHSPYDQSLLDNEANDLTDNYMTHTQADSSRSDIIRVQQTGISFITIILTAYLLQQRLL